MSGTCMIYKEICSRHTINPKEFEGVVLSPLLKMAIQKLIDSCNKVDMAVFLFFFFNPTLVLTK